MQATFRQASYPDNQTSNAQSELSKYFIRIRNSPPVNSVWNLWRQRHSVHPLLSLLAEDLVAAPAIQLYMEPLERLFSVCGWLTVGRRNCMEKSFEMRTYATYCTFD